MHTMAQKLKYHLYYYANTDDYVMIMEEALKLAASNMTISEDQVVAEWELQVRHFSLKQI